MTYRLILALAAATWMAATAVAQAQGTAAAPAPQPKTETLSTQHADPTVDRTVGESVKPEKNKEDGDLATAVRIDEQMSKESEGTSRRRHRR